MTAHRTDSDSQWFRRFRFSPEAAETARAQVRLSRRAITDGASSADLLVNLLELAWALTPLGHETEAAVLGRRALDLARSEGDVTSEIEALLHTGTALQYAGRPGEAMALFEAGVVRAQETGRLESLHYLRHHYGRLKAEQLDTNGARELFEAALDQRRELRDTALIQSSQTALAELGAWTDSRIPGTL